MEASGTYTVCAVCGKAGRSPDDKTEAVRNFDDLYQPGDNWTQGKGNYTKHGQ